MFSLRCHLRPKSCDLFLKYRECEEKWSAVIFNPCLGAATIGTLDSDFSQFLGNIDRTDI